MSRVWFTVFFAGFGWSAFEPHDYFTWFLEVLPAVVALVLLIATRRRFPLTPLSYVLILVHSLVLMVGAHYTYAEVPLFNTLKESLDLARNNYDKVGHFMQGFVPAIVAREILIRNAVVNGRWWLAAIVLATCLAISAAYELFEWFVAELTGEAAEAFLGTQGYAWDTQSDMLLALMGASISLALLSRLHDRQIRGLQDPAAVSASRAAG
jgi:putative membrane protein